MKKSINWKWLAKTGLILSLSLSCLTGIGIQSIAQVKAEEQVKVEKAASDTSVTKDNAEIRIVIVGDSTACDYDEKRAPRAGWGQTFQQFFTDKIVVKNYASSGRSTKSFIDEGKLDAALKDVRANDYLFIQFGHNDEKKEDEKRYTEANTTFKTYLTKYINSARELGAQPVLLTPIERRGFNADGSIKASHGEYPKAMLDLAAELKVPVIDITKKTQDLFGKLGEEKTKDLFLHLEPGVHSNYPTGVKDDTHFQDAGAIAIDKLVVEGLKELNHPLTKYLYMKPTITETKKIVLKLDSPVMLVNGKEQEIDPASKTAPILVDGSTLLPIRSIVEALGGSIDWNDADKKVTAKLNNNKVELLIGKTAVKVNGSFKNSEVAPQIINEKTFLPLRITAESLGCSVEWDGATKTITLVLLKN